jgi:hypothetical protein
MREFTGATDFELDNLLLGSDDRYLDIIDAAQEHDDDDAAFERWLSSVSGQDADRVLARLLSGPSAGALFRGGVA